MERFFEDVRSSILNYRLATCCFVAPLRAGVLAIGYFNVLLSLILIVATATETMGPLISHLQIQLMEEFSQSTCILVPSTELAFSVLLLCAAHRDDVVLLRVYMYYGVATVAVSVLVYSIVIASMNMLIIIVIIMSIAYQVYVVFLVRSLLVEIKLQEFANKNGALPRETYTKTASDAETPDEPPTPDTGPDDITTNVETVHEAPKLKTIEEGSEAATRDSGSVVKVTVTSTTDSKIEPTRVTGTAAKETSRSPLKSGANVKQLHLTEDAGTSGKDGEGEESGTAVDKTTTGKSRRRFWK